MEERGEYACRANASSGWFAIFPNKWRDQARLAQQCGRRGPNLIVYKTTTTDDRDHYVIPYSVLTSLLLEETLTHSKANGISRWNLTLKDGNLHVSHTTGSIEVAKYHRAQLIVERGEEPLANILLPEEIFENSVFIEGNVQRILVNRYERDTRARAECIKYYGATCFVCSFDFSEVYGEFMKGFIHVHHLRQLSEIAEDYLIDPIADLRPICPNCHSVAHRRSPPFTPEEIRDLLCR